MAKTLFWLSVYLLTAIGTPTAAQVSSQEGSSILIFPRVVVSEAEDTYIQITNLANNSSHAWCFFIDGASGARFDFSIFLARNQPRGWLVSEGGPARPVAAGFDGQLVCAQIDESRTPIAGNSFIGTATVVAKASRDRAKYNAVGLRGNPDAGNGDSVLCLGGDVSEACWTGAEYDACPNFWELDVRSSGSSSPHAGANSTLDGTITLAACSFDANAGSSPGGVLQLLVLNEYEQRFSTSRSFNRWASLRLPDISILRHSFLGTDRALVRATAVDVGLAIVVQEFHRAGDLVASSMTNGHAVGARASGIGDAWVLPSGCPPFEPYCF